jgi:hypothetical protein
MLRGHIDGLTPCGCIEGWALDTQQPLSMRHVSIFDSKGIEQGSGYAHRYRPDLVEGKLGTGWHGFRIRLRRMADLGASILILVDRLAGRQLHVSERLTLLDEEVVTIDSVESLLKTDPTTINSIDDLAGCESVFNATIGERGVEGFISLAYIYVLARAADPSAIATYSKEMRNGEISPFELLTILADTDEFRLRPRLLASPVALGFPFG